MKCWPAIATESNVEHRVLTGLLETWLPQNSVMIPCFPEPGHIGLHAVNLVMSDRISKQWHT